MKKRPDWHRWLSLVERVLADSINQEINQLKDRLTVLRTSQRRLSNTAAVRRLRAKGK